MEIDEAAHRDKIGNMKKEIEHLHALAREAKEAGHYDKAEAIFGEAKELERHIAKVAEGKKEKPHEEGLEHQVEKLRDEVSRLREDIEKLEDIVRQKVMDR